MTGCFTRVFASVRNSDVEYRSLISMVRILLVGLMSGVG
jgi:hypothetical protein